MPPRADDTATLENTTLAGQARVYGASTVRNCTLAGTVILTDTHAENVTLTGEEHIIGGHITSQDDVWTDRAPGDIHPWTWYRTPTGWALTVGCVHVPDITDGYDGTQHPPQRLHQPRQQHLDAIRWHAAQDPA